MRNLAPTICHPPSPSFLVQFPPTHMSASELQTHSPVCTGHMYRSFHLQSYRPCFQSNFSQHLLPPAPSGRLCHMFVIQLEPLFTVCIPSWDPLTILNDFFNSLCMLRFTLHAMKSYWFWQMHCIIIYNYIMFSLPWKVPLLTQPSPSQISGNHWSVYHLCRVCLFQNGMNGLL